MDGNFYGAKQWKCRNGHVLGVVLSKRIKTQVEDIKVEYNTSVLIIFRKAIDLNSETMDDVDACGILYGRMLLYFRWECSVLGCGCHRDWYPDDDALDWLQKRYGKEKAGA